MKKYVLNKQGKYGVKIFLCYTDIAIFTLQYSILPHPVQTQTGYSLLATSPQLTSISK